MTYNFPINDDNLIPHPQLGNLTLREYEILLLLAEDLDNDQITSHTKLSHRTVINMRSRIGDKLLLKGRNKLGQFARQNRHALKHWFSIFYPARIAMEGNPLKGT